MAKLKTLTDINGDKIYPQTAAAAVYMADGRTVESAIGSGSSTIAEYDDLPVGSVVFSALPLIDGRFLPVEEQILSKEDYPELVDILPWAFGNDKLISSVLVKDENASALSSVNSYKICSFSDKIYLYPTTNFCTEGGSNYRDRFLFSSTDDGVTWKTENLITLFGDSSINTSETYKVQKATNNFQLIVGKTRGL